jgi:cytochrome c5
MVSKLRRTVMKKLIWKSTYNKNKNAILLVILAMVSQWTLALDYPEAGNFSNGSKVWAENCARCHNMRSPTDLRDDQWVTTVFHMRVRAGLTGQETRDILTFLQGSNAKIEKTKHEIDNPIAVSKPASVSGKNVYENSCVACHGVNGKGSFQGVPDFTDRDGRLTKKDSELLSNIINGFQTKGSLMPMPPRGGNSQLSDADLSATLKYIKASFAK